MASARPAPELDRLRRGLRATFPWIGALRRRRAVAVLEARKDDAVFVPLLVEAAGSPHEVVRVRAAAILRAVAAPAAVEALCEAAIRAPGGPAAAACIERGLRPADPERACLFYFVTRQLDRYFEEDFEFQALRLEYDRADAVVRTSVMEVVRSGDRRCVGFFGSRKRLAECTDREIRLALQSFQKHGDWPRLFQAFLELPLRYGLPVLRELRRSGWEPADAESRGLLREALEVTRNQVFPQTPRRAPPSALFDRVLAAGRDAALAALDEAALLERLSKAPPLEGASIAAALAARPETSFAAAQAIESSPHWLVRLAGGVTGACADLTRDELADPCRWAAAVAPAVPFLELWPHGGTPAHIELLAAAGPDAWVGGLGAARRVLRLLIAHRVTSGSFEEMVVEPEAFAATFEGFDAAVEGA